MTPEKLNRIGEKGYVYRNNVKYSSLLFSILTRFKYHPTETVQCYKDRGGKFSLRMGFSSSR